jgi:hypothetical protein
MDGLLEKDKANEKILKEKQKGEKLIQRYTDQNKMKHDQKVEAKPRKFSVVSMMRLPSFKNAAPAPQMNKMAKEKSFMRRLFTTGKSKIGADLMGDMREDDEELNENYDENNELIVKNVEDDDDSFDGEDNKDEEGHGNEYDDSTVEDVARFNQEEEDANANQREFFDPPMPNIGLAGNVEKMKERTQKAENGLNTLLAMVKRETDVSQLLITKLPVSHTLDRVGVTEEVDAYIRTVQSRADIFALNRRNTVEIQKALAFRKSALVMMNSNYSKVLVRKIEPIYVAEARTLMEHK